MNKVLRIMLVVLTLFAACVTLTACGSRQFVDTTWTFKRAIVFTPSGEKLAEGKVESWSDYEDGDQLQVRIDGKTYLTAAENIVLISY